MLRPSHNCKLVTGLWTVRTVQAKNIEDAFSSCNEVLAAEPDNIDALCDRAETYINNEQYEEGTVTPYCYTYRLVVLM